MAAADECARLLRAGNLPREAAHARGVSLSTVLDYLDRAVGKGLIRRSDIYFSIPSGTRELVEKVKDERGFKLRRDAYDGYVHARPFEDALPHEDAGDIQVCLRYGPASRYYGDLYEELRGFEVDLHRLVRHVLEREYGTDARAWWFKGVDEAIRKDGAMRAEGLARDGYDPWYCLTLIETGIIVEKRWALFSSLLRASSGKAFKSEIQEVNDVRNRVMHPVRDMPPNEHDFDLVREARARVDSARATFYGVSAAAESRTT
ncbi:MAG TPA: hypothetical protein VHA79_08495 [Mycobacteriales bacterium]|nr:hypothetical protein [Mycobacteriales bacterium]